MRTVTLPPDVWAKITRRLTVEVGADDESRRLAAMINEQVNGAVKVRASRNGVVRLSAGAGGDLRNAAFVRGVK